MTYYLYEMRYTTYIFFIVVCVCVMSLGCMSVRLGNEGVYGVT